MSSLLHKSFTIAPFPGVLVIVALIVVALRNFGLLQTATPTVVIDTTDVNQLVGNCLGELEVADSLYEEGGTPSAADFSTVCLPPLTLSETPRYITVSSNAPALHGFRTAMLDRKTLELSIRDTEGG